MANDSQDSKLSTAANIIGLLTFALSALNLVIVRVLQNERRVIDQLRKREWEHSYMSMERKTRYIQLFDPTFAGFERINVYPGHTSITSSVVAAGQNLAVEDTGSTAAGLQEILKTLQDCYDQAKILIAQTEEILYVLAHQTSVTSEVTATLRLLLRWDLKGIYRVTMAVSREMWNWKETRENMSKVEHNYQVCEYTPIDLFLSLARKDTSQGLFTGTSWLMRWADQYLPWRRR